MTIDENDGRLLYLADITITNMITISRALFFFLLLFVVYICRLTTLVVMTRLYYALH